MAVAPPLMLASMALSAAGSIGEGVAEKKAQDRAARDDMENRRRSLGAGEEEAMDVLREALFQQGEAASSIGQGLVFGGSVSTVLADSARAAEIDIERVRAKAVGDANNYYTQAKERRRAGKAALAGGVFSAVAGAVGSAAQLRHSGQMAGIADRTRKAQFGSPGGGTKSSSGPSYSWRPQPYHRAVPR